MTGAFEKNDKYEANYFGVKWFILSKSTIISFWRLTICKNIIKFVTIFISTSFVQQFPFHFDFHAVFNAKLFVKVKELVSKI